ncbi:hypothetical protein NDU88_004105 [Pleurodeles waltl]|uniref:Uncharacterized protein n=1 Tax=Pleurodeles waltl TaxID=8319 RepID=A0AAV7TQH2_PLEWA|nr:hypothetical protein NDU88_004105 [Pleurodeles waltl]
MTGEGPSGAPGQLREVLDNKDLVQQWQLGTVDVEDVQGKAGGKQEGPGSPGTAAIDLAQLALSDDEEGTEEQWEDVLMFPSKPPKRMYGKLGSDSGPSGEGMGKVELSEVGPQQVQGSEFRMENRTGGQGQLADFTSTPDSFSYQQVSSMWGVADSGEPSPAPRPEVKCQRGPCGQLECSVGPYNVGAMR